MYQTVLVGDAGHIVVYMPTNIQSSCIHKMELIAASKIGEFLRQATDWKPTFVQHGLTGQGRA